MKVEGISGNGGRGGLYHNKPWEGVGYSRVKRVNGWSTDKEKKTHDGDWAELNLADISKSLNKTLLHKGSEFS